MDYQKLISEKWNLTAKFNCLEAIYFYAPSALAVSMCVMMMVKKIKKIICIWMYAISDEIRISK